jgi:hypothetical protein
MVFAGLAGARLSCRGAGKPAHPAGADGTKMHRRPPADNCPARTGGGHTDERWRYGAMALSRSSSWKEHRLAPRLEVDGGEYSVDLVARKATGVEGWKVTVVFLPRTEGAQEVNADLPNAASTAEVRRLVTELEGNEARLREIFRGQLRA